MHDTLAGRPRVQYEEYTQEERIALESKVLQYLKGQDQALEVTSLRMVYEAFSCFRKLHQHAEPAQPPTAGVTANHVDNEHPTGSPAVAQEAEPREGEVGE